MGRNNLTRVLAVCYVAGTRALANSSHPSSREGHRSADGGTRDFLLLAKSLDVLQDGSGRDVPCPAELRAIDPHAMHDYRQSPGECHDGLLLTAPFSDGHSPGLEPRPFLHARQHDLGGFVEQVAHHLIAAQRDSSNSMALSRLLDDSGGSRPPFRFNAAHRSGMNPSGNLGLKTPLLAQLVSAPLVLPLEWMDASGESFDAPGARGFASEV